MSIEEAERVLREIDGYQPPEPGMRANPGFAHYESELSISLGGDRQGRVRAVEIYRPERDVTVVFEGIDVFALPADEVIARVRALTRIESEDGGRLIVAPDLLLSLWRPTVPTDSDDDDGRYFDSVLVARPGYYDEATESRYLEMPSTVSNDDSSADGQDTLF